jgi:hypothetical protein
MEESMRIEVKYESSEGPHFFDISCEALEEMRSTGNLTLTQMVGSSGKIKTTTITGTNREKWLFAQALLSSMDV